MFQIRLCRNWMFWLQNIEGAVPWKIIQLIYVGNDSKKESRKKYEANRLAQKFSVKWKEGGRMVENVNCQLGTFV